MPGGRGADNSGSKASSNSKGSSSKGSSSKGSSSKGSSSKGSSSKGNSNSSDRGGSMGVGSGKDASSGGLGSGAMGGVGGLGSPSGGKGASSGGLGSGSFGGASLGGSVGRGGGGNDRRSQELARQAAWRAANVGKVTNEYRRDAQGNFTMQSRDYGAGTSYAGGTQHGRISSSRGVRGYEGAMSDMDFGRDVGRYGRTQSASLAESYMSASQMNLAADQAWQDGRYGDFLGAKLKAKAGFASVSLQNNIKDFQNAPLDYVSAMLDNPMLSAASVMSGFGLPAFGVKVADAISDYFQGEATAEESTRTALGSLITHTPVGAALGPVQGVAAGFARSPEQGAVAASGMLGGKFGALTGRAVAGLTSNPYAAAGITAVSAAAGSALAKKQATEAIAKSQTAPKTDQSVASYKASKGDQAASPLVTSGQQAVAKQEALMQPAKVDLYAQTVKELPFYGLDIDQMNNPYYGVY